MPDEEESLSALRHLVLALIDDRPEEIAWWLCANHPRFLLSHRNLDTRAVINLAKRAGTPPTGISWNAWYDRVQMIENRREEHDRG